MATELISPFAAWMNAATSEEQQALSDRVGTSRAVLYQLSSGHRNASADRAAAIEIATKEMAKASRGRLPVVLRTDLVAVCRACPYAQRCLGDRALASEFPVIA